jgi:hypothetical protein
MPKQRGNTKARGINIRTNYSDFATAALVLLVVICLLSPLGLASAVLAAASLEVSGALVDISLQPGETYVHTLNVTCSSSMSLDIQVEVRGFGQALDGSYIELNKAEDTNPYSALPCISHIDQTSFHLEPGGSQEVKATIQVPLDITQGTRYAIIYIHSQPIGNVILATDVPVILTIPGSEEIKTGEITNLTVSEAFSGEPFEIWTTFKNTGNYYFKVRNQITVTDKAGETIDTASSGITNSSIIPTSSRLLKVMPSFSNGSKGLPAGQYLAESKVTLDDGTVLDTEMVSFTVGEAKATPTAASETPVNNEQQPVPPGMSWAIAGGVILGVLVIGVLAGYLLARRAGKSRRNRAG